MYNINSEFYKVFDDEEFNAFIDKTYLKLENIKEKRDYNKIKYDVDSILNKYPVKYEFCVGIFGIPGSGKTTLAKEIAEEEGIEILSTDKFLAEIREDKIREENQSFPSPSGKSDDFRKHEYKTIACLILSGLANNKILDFGGKALLQPGLVLISQKVFGDRLINLSIDDEDRVYNLIQDAVILGDKSFRNTIKSDVNADKTITKENLEKLKKECVQLISEYGSLAKAKDKIKELKEYETFKKLYEICKKYDDPNRWGKEIFDEISEGLPFEKASYELSNKLKLNNKKII